jgi:DNA-binding response OmpR family regulator
LGRKPKADQKNGCRRILIVEDDIWFLETLETALQRLGYDTIGMHDGHEVEDSLLAHRADLLLSDLILPGRDGISMIASVRALFPDLPIIAMTGAGGGESDNLQFHALEIGVTDTIGKPFRLAELLDKVGQAFAA